MTSIEQLLPQSFRQDETDYWQAREKLLKTYKGKWVAFHQKEVIASGDDLYQVTLEAFQKSKQGAYITKVGVEDQIVTKVRFRQEFDYDSSYQPFPLPRITVRFSNFHYRDSILFPAYAEIGDVKYLCYIEAVEEVERLLGRDVLNQLTATFKGREQKVIFEG